MNLQILINEEINQLFETPADVVYQKYYASHLGGSLKTANPALHSFQQTDPDHDVPRKIFYKIISADPTTPIKNGQPDKLGKYSQWLLRMFINNRLKLEDLYKATDYLKIFDRYKQSELIPIKDINKLKTLPELFVNIEKQYNALKTGIPQTTGELERHIKAKETKKVYEDNKWLVVVPLTHRSACYYGKNTQWCTASNDDDHHFKHYTSKGPLFINIEKGTGQKYQFHFEDNQFMDETDSSIDFTDFFNTKENIPLRDFYVNYILEQKKNKKQSFDIGSDGVELHFEGDTPYLHAGSWGDFAEFFYERGSRHGINKKFIQDVLNGEGSGYFQLESGHIDHRDWIDKIDEDNNAIIQAYIDKVGLDDDNEDIYDHDNVARAIRFAVSNCEENAAEDAAYEYLTDQIISHFSIIRTDWGSREIKTKDGVKRKEFLKMQIQPNAAKNLILHTFFNDENYNEKDYDKYHPLGIEYDSPYYGWRGDVTDEFFNEELRVKLYDELD